MDWRRANCALFRDAAKGLKLAWNLDQQDPNAFPINTSLVLAKLQGDLRNEPRANSNESLPEPPPEPEALADLVDEKTIRTIYELRNRGSYKSALIEAAYGTEKGHLAWQKIRWAVDKAYEINHYGVQFAPKPKLHFLHNKLLLLTLTEPLNGLTDPEKANFFNFMCPCGEEHKANTIEKLRNRATHKKRKQSQPRKQRN